MGKLTFGVLFVRLYKTTGYYLSACANLWGTVCPPVQIDEVLFVRLCKLTGYYVSACAKMTGYYLSGVLFVRDSLMSALYESISILIIIYLLQNYLILIKICCNNISIAVSLIQYILYVKNTFYIAQYVLSHAERSHFIRNSDHCLIL